MRNNKETQFKQIIEENGERILRICKYYHSNSDDQKDLYQEILVNIWKSLDRFRGDSKLSTWVYRVAINTTLSFTGKVDRKMKLIINKDLSNFNILFDEDEPFSKVEYETNLDLLQTELNLLSIIDKTMISLMLEGLSTKEISDVIGLTEPNVRVKLHRIKEQLKNSFTINLSQNIKQ